MASTFNHRRVVILFSGGGSTALAVAAAKKQGVIQGLDFPLIIASRKAANRADVSEAFGLDEGSSLLIRPQDFPGPLAYEHALQEALTAHKIDTLALLGNIPLVPRGIVERYRGHAFNQHGGGLDPSRVHPDGTRRDFGGRGMQGRATHAAMFYFGNEMMTAAKSDVFILDVSSHHLGTGIDDGELIDHECVVIRRSDTFDAFRSRVLEAEHRLQIRVLSHYGRTGSFKRFYRSTPLIPDGYLPLLEQARRRAIEKYPRG